MGEKKNPHLRGQINLVSPGVDVGFMREISQL